MDIEFLIIKMIIFIYLSHKTTKYNTQNLLLKTKEFLRTGMHKDSSCFLLHKLAKL